MVEKKVDFLASERHYVDHMLPVYNALPKELQGEFIVGSYPVNPDRITVVASVGDYRRTSGPVVFMEHGCGLSYAGVNSPSYAGSSERERVILFLDVNEQTYSLNQKAHPDKKGVIVGAPKLDAWLARGKKERGNRAKVAHSFHWECKIVPETRSAFPHYKPELTRMMSQQRRLQWDMLGHGHPRLWPVVGPFWKRGGVLPVREFNDVVTLADVYVADNTSTIYEFAALDRPVVVLNAPWYRKNVNHGMRFWNHIPGQQVDNPHDLKDAIADAVHKDLFASERRKAVDFVYPVRGNSAQLAASAIAELF